MVGSNSSSSRPDQLSTADAAVGDGDRDPSPRAATVPPVAVHVRRPEPVDPPIPAHRTAKTLRAPRACADLIANSNSDAGTIPDSLIADGYAVGSAAVGLRPISRLSPVPVPHVSGTDHSRRTMAARMPTISVHDAVIIFSVLGAAIVLSVIWALIHHLMFRGRLRRFESRTNVLGSEVAHGTTSTLSLPSQISLDELTLVEEDVMRIEPQSVSDHAGHDFPIPVGSSTVASRANTERPSEPLSPISTPRITDEPAPDVEHGSILLPNPWSPSPTRSSPVIMTWPMPTSRS